MPRVAVPVTEIDIDGVVVPAATAADVANGHKVNIQGGGEVILRINNADGAAPHTATIVTPGTVQGQAIADVAIPVAASGEQVVHLDEELYAQNAGADKGQVYVDTQASLSFRAFRVRS